MRSGRFVSSGAPGVTRTPGTQFRKLLSVAEVLDISTVVSGLAGPRRAWTAAAVSETHEWFHGGARVRDSYGAALCTTHICTPESGLARLNDSLRCPTTRTRATRRNRPPPGGVDRRSPESPLLWPWHEPLSTGVPSSRKAVPEFFARGGEKGVRVLWRSSR